MPNAIHNHHYENALQNHFHFSFAFQSSLVDTQQQSFARPQITSNIKHALKQRKHTLPTPPTNLIDILVSLDALDLDEARADGVVEC